MIAFPDDRTPSALPRGSLRWAGYLLGFSMGGFFDGILLHQVLQWHHLLSAVEGPAFRDLRVQILADGLFHAAMYLLAAIGLWQLWRSRHAFVQAGSGRLLHGTFLIGFGIWHVLDGVLFHWTLGLHRIRMETESPLFWDLVFFIPGVLLVAVGWALCRTTSSGGTPGAGRRAVAPVVLAAAVLAGGTIAALPPPNLSPVLVLFRPGMTEQQALAAIAAVDGRIVWTDGTGDLWVIDIVDSSRKWRLYGHGALLVGGSVFPMGCFSWSRGV